METEVFTMRQETSKENYQEVISMEEYLSKRQKIREQEREGKIKRIQEKSPAWMWAELYV